MSDETATTGVETRPARSVWTRSVWVAVGWIVVHAAIFWLFPSQGVFRKYTLAAEQYLEGVLPDERLMDFSPLYLYLSLAAERLFGDADAVLMGLQIVLMALGAAMFYSLLEKRFGARLALVAIAVMAVDRNVLVYETTLEPEACLLFLLLAFLFFLDGRKRPFLAGFCAALSLAIRPNFLPVFLLVPFYFWLHRHHKQSHQEQSHHGRPWLKSSVRFLVPVAAVFLLLMVRAWAITGDPRTPVMNPGTVFFEGNNPLSHGTSAVYPPVVLAFVQHGDKIPDSAHQFYRDVARANAGRELSIAEVNAFWSERALLSIRAEPGRFLGLLGEKLLRSFHDFRWHDVPTAWRHDRLIPVPPVPFALVASLALLGLLFDAGRWRESLLYYALVFSQLAVMLVFYVSARQRLPLLPALLYFAAVSVEKLISERRWRWPLVGLIALLTVSLLLPNDLIRDELYRRQGYVETDRILNGLGAMKDQKAPIAWHAEEVLDALAASPWWLERIRPAGFPQEKRPLEEQLADVLTRRRLKAPPSRLDRAVIDLKAGRLDAAQAELESLCEEGRRFYRTAFQSSEPSFFLSRIAARRGEKARAVELLEEALLRSPGDPFVLAELLVLTEEPRYQRPLLDSLGSIDAQFLIGQALLFHERPREAAAAFGFVVKRMPDFREAHLLLAVALGESGRLEEGVRQYREAMRYGVEPILHSRKTVALFERWLALHPERPEARLFTAQVLHQHGRLATALRLLEEGAAPPAALRSGWERELHQLRKALSPPRAPDPASNPAPLGVPDDFVDLELQAHGETVAQDPGGQSLRIELAVDG